MRLLLTTLAAAIIVFFVITTTRIWGLGQTFVEYKHDFFNGPQPMLVLKTSNVDSANETIAKNKNVILWLDVRASSDGKVFVLSKNEDVKFLNDIAQKQEANPTTKIMLGSKLSDYDYNTLLNFYKSLPLLSDFYSKFAEQRFIINVVDNIANIQDTVVNAIKDLNPANRTLVQSDTLVVMTSIRELKAEWVYGTSQADLMRFLSFNSMWILPSTQYKGDVFIAPFEIVKRPAFNDDVIAEMRRRHKKVFLGPITNKSQFDEAKRLNADAFITENFQELSEWLDQSQSQ